MMAEPVFINRRNEIAQVENFVSSDMTGGPKMLIVETEPSSGITYFFKHMVRKFRMDEKMVVFYINGQINLINDIYRQCLSQFFNYYSSHVSALNSTEETTESRFQLVNLFAAGVEVIPYAGTLLREFVEQNQEFKLGKKNTFGENYYGPTPAELVKRIIQSLKGKRIILFIDDIKALDLSSLSLFKSTIGDSFSHIFYVASFVSGDNIDSNSEEIRLLQEFPFLSIYNKISIPFLKPNAKFIMEIGQGIANQNLTYLDAVQIAKKTDGQIYEVLNSLDQVTSPDVEKFTIIQREIINLLRIAKQPLKESDIEKIIFTSKDIFAESIQEIKNSLAQLNEWDVIDSYDFSGRDIVINLTHSKGLKIDRISEVDSLRITEKLFTHYFQRVENSFDFSKYEIFPLLYRLSKEIRPDKVREFALEIVSLSLGSGSSDLANTFIGDLDKKNITSFEDFVIVTSLLFNAKKYSQIDQMLINPIYQIWKNQRDFKLISAITFNRVRKHKDSEELIFDLLDSNKTKEEKVSLLIYLISGRLHQNEVVEARQIFLGEEKKLIGAKNFGYFIRNGASTLGSPEAILKLNEAIEIFSKTNDVFGKATCLNNLGVNLLRLRKFDQARKVFEKAQILFENFGTQHLSLFLNNLAICEMYTNNFQLAEKYLLQAKSCTESSMPRIFIAINRAIFHFLQDQKDMAIEVLKKIENDVIKHEVDRVRQKYYTNLSLILAFLNSANLEDVKVKANLYPLREDPSTTRKKITGCLPGLSRDQVISNFEPCFLVYWYHNPLNYISWNVDD